MADTNIGQTTTTNLDNAIKDYSVSLETPESPYTDEFYYNNPDFTKYFGYYKAIPELKKAIDALAIWTTGKGFETDTGTKVLLEDMRGQGKDTIYSILFNLFVTKKINGDAYAQILKRDDRLINLKPLNPSRVRIVFDKQGLIKRYEHIQVDRSWKKIQPEDMLHLVNERVTDEVHGISIIEAVKWVIDARNEAMSDKRRVHHRSTIRIIEVDTEDTSKLSTIKTQYANAIKNGEVLLVPKGNYSFPDTPISYLDTQAWISYLENFFYQAVGVPRVIATSENFTEASSKVGYLTFEPIYTREQLLLEAELWAQLNIKLKFNRPPSLAGNIQRDEAKNTGQLGFQQSDIQEESLNA